MKKNMAPLLAIAFIVAIISTGLFYGLFASKLKNASSDLPRQTAVVASRNVPSGAVLSTADVRLAEFRAPAAFSGSFTAIQQVAGFTTREPLEQNQVLTKSSFASRIPVDGIPVGMRALTIHVVESGGVLALLGRGSKVDVQAISEGKIAAVRTVLPNIEVLSIGAQPEPVSGRFSAPHVTVLVRPQDADLLASADTATRLRLSLRNVLDGGVEVGVPRREKLLPSNED